MCYRNVIQGKVPYLGSCIWNVLIKTSIAVLQDTERERERLTLLYNLSLLFMVSKCVYVTSKTHVLI